MLHALRKCFILPQKARKGFTLPELLISLALLGVIATFTIPKIMTQYQYQSYNAKTKEVVAILEGALQTAKTSGTLSSSTGVKDLSAYFNYVKQDTSTVVLGNITCGVWYGCLDLHNGTLLFYDHAPSDNFGGTNTTNAVWFSVFPDMSSYGLNNRVTFWFYYDGKIKTWAYMLPNTTTGAGNWGSATAADPTWFSW